MIIILLFSTDKDECSVNNGGCSHTCVNTAGSFLCACPKGYTLDMNKSTCIGKPSYSLCTHFRGSFFCEWTVQIFLPIFILRMDNFFM